MLFSVEGKAVRGMFSEKNNCFFSRRGLEFWKKYAYIVGIKMIRWIESLSGSATATEFRIPRQFVLFFLFQKPKENVENGGSNLKRCLQDV